MTAFRTVVRALALLALISGAVDVVIGLSGQQTIGAALEEGYGDFPPSELGRGFVIGATAIEIIGMPLLLLWMGRLLPPSA